MSGRIIKLSDERVREILQSAQTENDLLHPTVDEVAALAQAVLDLRTSVRLYEAILEREDAEAASALAGPVVQ